MVIELKLITRFLCVFVTVVSNCFGFGYLYYHTYYKPTQTKRKINIDPIILNLTFFYIVWATITTIYNIAYRFIINENDCRVSDTIEEYLVAIGRTYLLLFFTFRVEYAFKNSCFCFNTKYINIFRIFIIVESVAINTFWIVNMSVRPVVSLNGKFGIYCSNTGDLSWILCHYFIDFCFNIIVLSMFVDRLIKVTMIAASNERRRSLQNEKKNNNKKINKNKNNSQMCNNPFDLNLSKTKSLKSVVAQIDAKNDQLIRIGIRQTILTSISILSTWIFGLNSIIDVNEQLGWFYPLDWAINVICIVCMFKFVKCQCCTNACVNCIIGCSKINDMISGINKTDEQNLADIVVSGNEIERDNTGDSGINTPSKAKFVPFVWARALKSQSSVKPIQTQSLTLIDITSTSLSSTKTLSLNSTNNTIRDGDRDNMGIKKI